MREPLGQMAEVDKNKRSMLQGFESESSLVPLRFFTQSRGCPAPRNGEGFDGRDQHDEPPQVCRTRRRQIQG